MSKKAKNELIGLRQGNAEILHVISDLNTLLFALVRQRGGVISLTAADIAVMRRGDRLNVSALRDGGMRLECVIRTAAPSDGEAGSQHANAGDSRGAAAVKGEGALPASGQTL